MKAIILAGGTGSRLFPITNAVCKQLLPVYDKPMIYYPISVAMLAGIRDILIIVNSRDIESFTDLLGDGSQFGINISYAIQNSPDGIAQAFIIGQNFIGSDSVCLVLGDNIFYGTGFSKQLQRAKNASGATIFGYKVHDPTRYGVIEFDTNKSVISLEEKPDNPKSNFAATGLYFYDNEVITISKQIKPSDRGELEITAVNNVYLERNELSVELLGRGFAWLDTGTPDSLIEANQFVATVQNRQGFKIACLEEIAYLEGWISNLEMEESIQKFKSSEYSKYLKSIITKKDPKGIT